MRVLSGFLLASLAFAQFPSGESLLDRALLRSGGAAAYAKVKSVVLAGNVELAGHNITGPVAIYQQGDKSYSVIEFPGIGKVEEGCDGETAWETNAMQGARVKDGQEKTVSMRASKMTLLNSWREQYKSARTLGAEDVDGKPAWKVEMTPADEGKPEVFYFDKQSALLVRMTQTLPTALGDIPVDIAFSDYRQVNGIQTPFLMIQKAMSQTLNMRFDKVSYNAAIATDRFDLPAAVKAILDRKKQP